MWSQFGDSAADKFPGLHGVLDKSLSSGRLQEDIRVLNTCYNVAIKTLAVELTRKGHLFNFKDCGDYFQCNPGGPTYASHGSLPNPQRAEKRWAVSPRKTGKIVYCNRRRRCGPRTTYADNYCGQKSVVDRDTDKFENMKNILMSYASVAKVIASLEPVAMSIYEKAGEGENWNQDYASAELLRLVGLVRPKLQNINENFITIKTSREFKSFKSPASAALSRPYQGCVLRKSSRESDNW
ncbi:unnamed protein product [Polarella glacialis]|uniref:Uncharacterized protein n=1 Tax=Polarella glacialis TaxID=89957 RepID=A0A813IML2_POLGL|nr:unnamed protein product [Polarella glacialis]